MEISREKLLKAVESVLPGLSQQELIEQSSCVVFKDKMLYTYNDEVACRCATEVDIQGAFKAMLLVNLLRKLTEKTLELTVEDNRLLIKGKGRKSGLRFDEEIMLPLDAIDTPTEWKKLPSKFTEAVKATIGFSGKDESKFILTCLHIHPDWIEASDNKRVARFTLKTKFDTSVLIRSASIKNILSLNATEFGETDKWVHFKNADGVILSCRRYLETFPEMTDILDVTGTEFSIPKVQKVKEESERAKDFTSEDDTIEIVLKKNKMIIDGSNNGNFYIGGVKIKYDGEPKKFRIETSILNSILDKHNKYIVSDNRIKIELENIVYVSALHIVSE